jgi:hypothetical protein
MYLGPHFLEQHLALDELVVCESNSMPLLAVVKDEELVAHQLFDLDFTKWKSVLYRWGNRQRLHAAASGKEARGICEVVREEVIAV